MQGGGIIGSLDALLLLVYLMPGLIGMLVFESFAEIKKRQFSEKIGFIVLFTIVSVLVVSQYRPVDILPNIESMKHSPVTISTVIKNNIFHASVVSICLGMLFAFIANSKILFFLANKARMSNRTGAVDPWQQVFSRFRKKWVQIRFEDGSRIVGWPKYYSEDGEAKEIFIAEATWYIPNNCQKDQDGTINYQEIEVEGEGVLISSFTKVKAVEFLTGDVNDERADKNTIN